LEYEVLPDPAFGDRVEMLGDEGEGEGGRGIELECDAFEQFLREGHEFRAVREVRGR
jgi:hypothetical protein